jgi:hypothetical protein
MAIEMELPCAKKSTLDIEIVPMGDEAASHGESVRQRDKWRHAYRQGCRRVYWLSKECRKVFDRPCAARRPTSVGGLQRQGNAIDTNKYVSITKLTRVKMFVDRSEASGSTQQSHSWQNKDKR